MARRGLPKPERNRARESLARIQSLAGPRLVIIAILMGAWAILVGGIFLWLAVRAI